MFKKLNFAYLIILVITTIVNCTPTNTLEQNIISLEENVNNGEYNSVLVASKKLLGTLDKNDSNTKPLLMRVYRSQLKSWAHLKDSKNISSTLGLIAQDKDLRLQPNLVLALGDILLKKKDKMGAINIFDQGFKLFPNETSFKTKINSIKESLNNAEDSAEIERLKSLGYIND